MMTNDELNAERRKELRRFDDCLEILERAHELDFTLVTEQIAVRLNDRVPSITPGMSIVDAIEEVWRYQEPFMIRSKTPNNDDRRKVNSRRYQHTDINAIIGNANHDGKHPDKAFDAFNFLTPRRVKPRNH